jgi:hypothetical protein
MSDRAQRYYICVKNEGYLASLQLCTVYLGVSDPEAESHGMLRIVDESGEDYLFPASFFVPIDVPEAAIAAFAGRGLTTRSS